MMGNVNLLAVFLGALAFFVVGALWYGPLFGKTWQRADRVTTATSCPTRRREPDAGDHGAVHSCSNC